MTRWQSRWPWTGGSRYFALLALPALLALSAGSPLGQESLWRGLVRAQDRNLDALSYYRWNSRTEITLGGQLQQVLFVEESYDLQGNTQRIELDPPNDEKSSASRATGKTKKIAEVHADLKKLLRSYTEFSDKQIRSAFSRASAHPAGGTDQGLLRVRIRNVLRDGDSMFLWTDKATHRLHRYEISTSLHGKPVKVRMEYWELGQDGPLYPALSTITTEIKSKELVIRTETSNYEREGG